MAQWDLANSDCIVIMGSNMAENHPIAFRFVMQAKERGATVIHVDPRFTRTSALADIYAPIRAGTDIAFLGGVIRYILENDLWFREYALPYTNIADDHRPGLPGRRSELDGMFSGWDEDEARATSLDTLAVRGHGECRPHWPSTTSHTTETFAAMTPKLTEQARRRRTRRCSTRRCVYQILKRQYAALHAGDGRAGRRAARARPSSRSAEAMTRNSGRERTGAFCYAVGWTHHTTGVQMIRAAAHDPGAARQYRAARAAASWRCAAMPASRAAPTSRRSTTCCPATSRSRTPTSRTRLWRQYLEAETPPTGWWHNFPKYIVSLLKAWYGEHADRGRTIGASSGCRRSSATIRSCR